MQQHYVKQDRFINDIFHYIQGYNINTNQSFYPFTRKHSIKLVRPGNFITYDNLAPQTQGIIDKLKKPGSILQKYTRCPTGIRLLHNNRYAIPLIELFNECKYNSKIGLPNRNRLHITYIGFDAVSIASLESFKLTEQNNVCVICR